MQQIGVQIHIDEKGLSKIITLRENTRNVDSHFSEVLPNDDDNNNNNNNNNNVCPSLIQF